MGEDRLPTFVCIGAMKCETSSLHRYLGEHPQVCVSTPKETDFFLARNGKDLAWYHGASRNRRGHTGRSRRTTQSNLLIRVS